MLSPAPYTLPAILLSMLFQQTVCVAQQTGLDTAFLAASKKRIISLYAESIQRQSRLYNGVDYIIYRPKYEEHPYFELDDWIDGSIVYWGELYENVPLLYDLSIDQVITEHNRGNPIKLIAEKIESFKIAGHTFVRLGKEVSDNFSEGFYDRLYDGDSKVYAKYQKTHRETLEAKEVIPRFDESVRYYIVKDGVVNIVKTKGSVLQVFEDRKQDVKNFIRKNRIYFKNNRDVAIVRITEYYDILTD